MSDKSNATISKQHKTQVYCDGEDYVVNCIVTTREGATEEMIVDTMRHYLHTLKRLSGGYDNAKDDFQERKDYYGAKTEYFEGYVVPEQPLVSVWTKSVYPDFLPGAPVLLDNGHTFVSINVCTEFTSAQMLLDVVWTHIRAFSSIWETKVIIDADVVKPQSELDNHFGERKQPTQPTPPTDGSTPPPVPLANIISIPEYSYKKGDSNSGDCSYSINYVGKVVAVNASKIRRFVGTGKNGQYECLHVYGYYDGLASDKPSYDLTMFRNDDADFGNWKTFFKTMETGELSEAGNEIGSVILYYKLNADKKGKLDSRGNPVVYWNLRKWEYVLSPQHVPMPEAETTETHPDEKVPF